MPRTKQTANGTENISGYFRAIFKGNPKLLKSRGNDELLARWLADHPKQKEVPARVKQGLANVKSVLRSKRRGRKRKAQIEQGTLAVLERPRPSHRLETLEERVDDALTMARNLDRQGLESVIAALRRARNEVVWKMGQ